MANTFSQIYIQTVFAVSGRLSLITSDFKEELHKYITGIVKKQGQKLISLNGMPDHPNHATQPTSQVGKGGLPPLVRERQIRFDTVSAVGGISDFLHSLCG
jgi:Transposase IS200 like